jgi:spore maturation protein CgeB
MRIVMFYHSLLSDWNHGNAHFLRGIATELLARGHEVMVFEPQTAWSLTHLIAEHGVGPIKEFRRTYPRLVSFRYDPRQLDLDWALEGADLVIVHEWNDQALVERIGRHRRRNRSYRLLFHDTHHRSVTDPRSMAAYNLAHYDGVLAYGEIIRRIYLERGWVDAAWTWHEAADIRIFKPQAANGLAQRGQGRENAAKGDLVWIGNWGDEERTAELHEFLMEPARRLKLAGCVYGVRYPSAAIKDLIAAGLTYAGWLPNYKVPKVFAGFRVTIHIPRRPYVAALPGIPTIRPFEALACGIPLVCSPWEDADRLFTPGKDFLIARNGREMEEQISMLLREPEAARALAAHGYRTVLQRHTCRHRVDELMAIARELGLTGAPEAIGQEASGATDGDKVTGATAGLYPECEGGKS